MFFFYSKSFFGCPQKVTKSNSKKKRGNFFEKKLFFENVFGKKFFPKIFSKKKFSKKHFPFFLLQDLVTFGGQQKFIFL